MSETSTSEIGLSVTAGLAAISARLTDAAAVAWAAVVCAEAGSEREAVRIALDLDEMLSEATTLHAAVCLIGRINRRAAKATATRAAASQHGCLPLPRRSARGPIAGSGRWQGSPAATEVPAMTDKVPTPPAIATTNAIATTAITLTRTETGLLLAAAADDGRLTFAAGTKPATWARLLARILRDGLVTPSGGADGAGGADAADGPHRLTSAGYRAVGRTRPCPPREVTIGADAPAGAASEAAPSKKAQVLALLRREQGATLAELTAATGWLPHTARAALSRIRTGGQALVKATRADAATAYRIPAPVALPARARKPRRPRSVDAASMPAPAAA